MWHAESSDGLHATTAVIVTDWIHIIRSCAPIAVAPSMICSVIEIKPKSIMTVLHAWKEVAATR